MFWKNWEPGVVILLVLLIVVTIFIRRALANQHPTVFQLRLPSNHPRPHCERLKDL